MMNMEQKRTFRWAAVLSYVLGFIYIDWYAAPGIDLDRLLDYRWGNLVFTILYIAAVELFSAKCGMTLSELRRRTSPDGRNLSGCAAESVFFAGLALLQSLASVLWDIHPEEIGLMQVLMWHFTMIYYVLCRTGTLAAGHTGIFFLLDAFQGTVVLPWKNIFLRFLSIWTRSRKPEEPDQSLEQTEGQEVSKEQRTARKNEKMQKAGILFISVLTALIVCMIAWKELLGVSTAFASFGTGLADLMERLLSTKVLEKLIRTYLPEFLLSIPVSAWLFGLIGGALKEGRAPVSDAEFSESTRRYHIFPAYSAYIVLGALIAVYVLFFAVGAADLVSKLGGGTGLFSKETLMDRVTVYEAASGAISGFWQLVRIVLLNFSVLLGFCLFSDVPLWERKKTRVLVTVLFGFATVFALMAGYRLFVLYLFLYGPTPRRILSGWIICVLLLWCILTLIRFFKKIPAVRIGILAAAASFTVLCLFNIRGICY